MTLRSALLAATIVALPLAANAQPLNGLYIGAGGGLNIMQNESFSAPVGSQKMNLGGVGVLSLGWGFGNGLRAEIEGDYRYNKLNSSGGGNDQKFGGMANVLYDFNDISPSFIPYLGAGIGYQAVRWSVVSQTKGSFAYQGIAGAAFPIAAVPGLAVTAEYRFMGLAGNRNYTTADGAAFSSTNNYNHDVMLGIRYAFGAPAAQMTSAASTTAPAAAMARSYLVFFDWDKSNLTDRARGIIKDAAANSTKVAYTKIDVNGNADTSGTPQYNQGLSMRRAQSVAAELVKDGVPKAAIAITASGDTHLLVPTGPGVREPQNRRVEIVIR